MTTSTFDGPATVFGPGGAIPVHAELTGERPAQGPESWNGDLWAVAPEEDFAALLGSRAGRLQFRDGETREFVVRRVVQGEERALLHVTGSGPVPF
ncbi:hypothetical protein ACIGXM_09240 [Kitasatospora sp. NPDC052896]|uniref:hypothetical protein n=1 Tax=Kitasatospora sp. NPDC052896 TaxID=3364061 RepID=UPI0037CBA39D